MVEVGWTRAGSRGIPTPSTPAAQRQDQRRIVVGYVDKANEAAAQGVGHPSTLDREEVD